MAALQADLQSDMEVKTAADAVAADFEAMGGEALELFQATYAAVETSAFVKSKAVAAMQEMMSQ